MNRMLCIGALALVGVAAGCEKEQPKNDLTGALQGAADAAGKAASDASKAAGDATKAVTEAAKDAGAAAKDTAISGFTELYDKAKVQANDLISKASAAAPELKAQVDPIVAKVKEQLGGLDKLVADLKSSGTWESLLGEGKKQLEALTTSLGDLKGKLGL